MRAVSKFGTPKFFNSTRLSVTEATKPVFVDVGGTGDCGFRSIAAALISHVLSKKMPSKPDILKQLLDRHANYYPSQQPLGHFLTSADRLEQMIKRFGMAAIIRSLAFTLRQLAVDEMVSHPECYQGAFSDKNEGTSPKVMRQEGTWIDEAAIAALSKVLDFPIDVQVLEKNKELPLRFHYNSSSKQAPLVIELYQKHYRPQVAQPELFEPTSRQVSRSIEPVTSHTAPDPELADILAKIAEENQHLLEQFEKTSQQLSIMLAAGEMTKDDLLTIYVEGMKHSDYLEGRVKYVGLEHGNQQFFEAIEQTRTGIKRNNDLPQENHENQITKELIHAISRAMSIGHLDSSFVFSRIDGISTVKKI